MPYDEKMADRIREIIAERNDNVYEKKMFGGLAFLVDDKLCVAVKADKIFVRLAPDVYEAALDRDGVSPMKRANTAMKGYLYVNFDQIRTIKQLNHWIGLALDFNPLAERSPRK